MLCKHCGAQMPEGTRFCSECGARLSANADDRVPPRQPDMTSPHQRVLSPADKKDPPAAEETPELIMPE